jgi:hypothetical protein
MYLYPFFFQLCGSKSLAIVSKILAFFCRIYTHFIFSPSDKDLPKKVTSLYNNILNMGKDIVRRHAFDKF